MKHGLLIALLVCRSLAAQAGQYTAESGGASLKAKLFLVDGVTFRPVQEHFRRFQDEIKTFETRPERN